MNRIRKYLFLLLLTSLPFLGEDLFAQIANNKIYSIKEVSYTPKANKAGESANANMRLGYCTTEYSRGLIAQINGSHVYHAAIFLPKEILNKYVGNKIDSIEFAIKPKRGTFAEVFVCTDIHEMFNTSLASGMSTQYSEGWNKVKLNRPVTIKKDMELYLGYALHLEDGENYDCLLFDESKYSLKGKNWYGYDYSWFNNTEGIGKNISVRAVMSGSTVPENDITLTYLTPVDGGGYAYQNKDRSYYAYIQNNGKTPINSLSVKVEAKGQQSAEVTLNGFDVPNNTPQRVRLDNIKIPVEGNYTATFTVTKVNGAADPDASDNMFGDTGYSIKEGTGPVQRTTLFEEFSSEGYDQCATADTMYQRILNEHENVIRVKHHLAYKGIQDQFTIPEDDSYTRLYGESNLFVPAICVDRISVSGLDEPGPAYFIADEPSVNKFLEISKGIYSFITLNVEPKADAANNKLNVKVTGHAGTNEMPLQSDLRITTWLIEDGVVSTKQAGQTNFVQNGVLRKVISSNAWGDQLDISAYDFEKNYSIDLKPEWKTQNLRVVSFVSNYSGTNTKRLAVYNAAQGYCDKEHSGISQTTASRQPAIYVIEGKLFAEQGYKLIGVYDLSGRTVANSQLRRGIYVVRVTDGTTVINKKISIN